MAFNFLKKLARGDEKPGGGVFGFLRDVGSDVGKVATTPYNLTRLGAANVSGVRGQAEAARRDLGGAQKVAQTYITRPVLRTGQSLFGGETINPDEVRNQELFKAIFGDEPISSYQETYGQQREAGRGVPAALGIASLMAAGDVPFLPGSKVTNKLIKAKTAQDVKKVLGKIDDDTARQIAVATDRYAIENILNKGKTTPPSILPPQAIKGEVLPEPPVIAQDITNLLRGTPASKGVTPVKGAKGLRREQEILYSQARGKKFTASKAAGKKLEGSEGYFAERSALQGELPKVEFSGIAQKFSPDKAEDIFTQGRAHVQSLPDETFTRLGLEPNSARFNTQTALRKATHGEDGVPTFSDIKLLENAFGKEMADTVRSSIPIFERMKNLAAQLVGVPRTVMTSFLDLSFGLRQGLVLGSRHPKEWTRANIESVKYMKNESYFNKEMVRMAKAPEYEVMSKDMGVALTGITKQSEEAFVALDIAGKIPGIRRTARAYDGTATRFRFDVAKKLIDSYGGIDWVKQNLTPRELKDLGEFINTASGRGGKAGGLLSKHAGLLSTTLFSPRLWASRLNTLNPYYYARLSGPAQKQALQSAGAFAAVAGTVLTALNAMGAEIETDPRSADFLKAKFGDTRYDVLGGFQQNIVFAWRELSGENKSSQTGKVTVLSGEDKPYGGADRISIAGNLVENKLNPIFATAGHFIRGEDRSGQPVNPYTEIARLFAPLNFQSAYDAAKNEEDVVKGITMAVPGFFGTGVQTYGIKDLNISDKQTEHIEKLKQQGASTGQQKATKNFFQNLKVGSSSKDDQLKKFDEAYEAGNVDEAQRIADDYNEQLAQALDKWGEQYGQYATDDLKRTYQESKINPRTRVKAIRSRLKKSSRELQLVP